MSTFPFPYPRISPGVPTEEDHKPVIERVLAELENLYTARQAEGRPLMLLSETQMLLELRWTLELPGGIAYTKRNAEDGQYISQAIHVRFEDNPRVMCIGLSGAVGTGIDLWVVQVKTINRGWVPTDKKNHEVAITRAEKVLAEALASTKPRHWENREECAEYLRLLMLDYVPR